MNLPLEYRWLKAHKFEGLTPWYLVDPMDSNGVRKEYQLETGKDILPFARRQDNDDIAGFEVVNDQPTSKILTVHLTWSSKLERKGYPITKASKNIFSWISDTVIPATQEWMSEEDLLDIIEDN